MLQVNLPIFLRLQSTPRLPIGSYDTIVKSTFNFHALGSDGVSEPGTRQQNITLPRTQRTDRQMQGPTRPIRDKDIMLRKLEFLRGVEFGNCASRLGGSLGVGITICLVSMQSVVDSFNGHGRRLQVPKDGRVANCEREEARCALSFSDG